MLDISDVIRTSIGPDSAHVRTVLAGVFNRDIHNGHSEEISEHEAVVVLAAKMLLDMGHKSGYVQAIFRLNKERLLGKRLDGVLPVLLSISDNRYAVVFGDVNDYVPVYDYTTGERCAMPGTPLLQLSINLTKLLGIVRATAADRESHAPKAVS